MNSNYGGNDEPDKPGFGESFESTLELIDKEYWIDLFNSWILEHPKFYGFVQSINSILQ